MADSKEKILEATYKVLIQEGYSGLSIRKIADKAEIDKSLIYHHFGSKKDLIIGFLDLIAKEVQKEHQKILRTENKEKMLEKLLNFSFSFDEPGHWELEKALMEIQAQASKDEQLSEKLQELDEIFLTDLNQIFDKLGSETPRSDSEIYLSLVYGSISRKAAIQDKKGLERLRSQVKEVITARTKK